MHTRPIRKSAAAEINWKAGVRTRVRKRKDGSRLHNCGAICGETSETKISALFLLCTSFFILYVHMRIFNFLKWSINLWAKDFKAS